MIHFFISNLIVKWTVLDKRQMFSKTNSFITWSAQMFDLQYSNSKSRCKQKTLALTQLFSEQKWEEFIVCSQAKGFKFFRTNWVSN